MRHELGMPPPGDLRRCACAMATRRELARRLDARIGAGRSIGNLWLAERFSRHRDLQRAADELAEWLGVTGRICPAALGACTLIADLTDGSRAVGELTVERARARVRALRVMAAPDSANPAAIAAIGDADLIVLGPGSFYTSTLAAALTPGISRALKQSRAPKILVQNLRAEDAKTAGFGAEDYLAELRRHVGIEAISSSVHDIATIDRDLHDPSALASELCRLVETANAPELARAS